MMGFLSWFPTQRGLFNTIQRECPVREDGLYLCMTTFGTFPLLVMDEVTLYHREDAYHLASPLLSGPSVLRLGHKRQ